MDLAPGQRVDRYVLIEVLGEGGQGAVWKAEDPLEPEHARALKLVPLVQSRPTDVERIRREARALARLSHPSLVACHGLFEDLKLGLLGLSMDFVDGSSLRKLRDDPAFTARHRVALLRHIASALAYLHGESVVHRDLKPENVLVTSAFLDHPDDPATVKLVDFGIASEEGNPNPLTALDSVVGTLSFLAPELVDPGFFGRQVSTPAADVFAFGVLAWQLIGDSRHPTGLPAKASIIEYGIEYRRVAQAGLPFPGGGPGGEWGELLRGCLAVRHADRIQNGSQLAERCEAAARSNVVVRPRRSTGAASALLPTSVDSPGASAGPTGAVDEPGPTRVERRAADSEGEATVIAPASVLPGPHKGATSSAVTARTAVAATTSTPARGGAGKLAVGLGLIAIAGIAATAWLLSAPHGPSVAPAVVAPAPSASIAAEVPAPSASATPSAAASVIAPPSNLPSDCTADASTCGCCASGHDCGGVCDALLPSDARFDLRLASVDVEDAAGRALVDNDLLVCFSVVGVQSPRVCSQPSRVGTSAAIAVAVADLERGGIDVDLWSKGKKLAGRLHTPYSAHVPRSALCKGLAVEQGFTGSVRVDAVRFWLDTPGVAPIRCK